MKILYIEDQLELQEVLKAIFMCRGISMYSAYSLAEASNLIQHDTFSLVISDEFLPDGRGSDWFRKNESKLNGVELVLYTGTLDNYASGRAQVVHKTDIVKLSSIIEKCQLVARRATG